PLRRLLARTKALAIRQPNLRPRNMLASLNRHGTDITALKDVETIVRPVRGAVDPQSKQKFLSKTYARRLYRAGFRGATSNLVEWRLARQRKTRPWSAVPLQQCFDRRLHQ